jgi:16S rRNA (adenine1518-N6/adenine1519-N6)-dimethyltransferase
MKPPHSTHHISRKMLLEHISRYQFFPKKRFGQNFLIDQNITSIIIKVLHLTKEDSIFEIGTGMGSLTLALIPSVKHVFSIEKDIYLKPILDDLFSNYLECLTILYQDILTFDLGGFLERKTQEGYKIEKIAGNLPYSISLPLLRKLMEMQSHVKMAVVMVQKEVAERMMAQPGDKNYGMISVMSKYYSSIEKIHLVKSDVFYPKPEVDSMIIRIKFLDKPIVQVEDEVLFFDLIRAVFQHRRKNINNALKLYFGERIDKDKLEKSLQKLGLGTGERGENFSLPEFAQLASEIKKIIK